MGIIIEATAISEGIDGQGSIELAVNAAKECISASGIEMEDIGILINLGIYREDNTVEPAMAALIQKNLRLNLDPFRNFPSKKSTFCFDLANGSSGFLNAVQIVDALMKNKRTKYALIVSSEVHPSKIRSEGFPYTHCGAAVILTYSNKEEKGFKKIMMKNSQDKDYSGVKGYTNLFEFGTESRKHVVVKTEEDYANKLQVLTIETVKEYVESENIDLNKTKLIITQPTQEFSSNVAKTIGHSENVIVDIYEKYGDPNSSALSIGYHMALTNKNLKEGDQLLFISASSGLTAACGLYNM